MNPENFTNDLGTENQETENEYDQKASESEVENFQKEFVLNT